MQRSSSSVRSRAGRRSCATLNAHPSPKPNANPNANPSPDPNPKQELRDLAGTLQCNYEAQSRKQAGPAGLGLGSALVLPTALLAFLRPVPLPL